MDECEPINRRQGEIAGWATVRLCHASSYFSAVVCLCRTGRTAAIVAGFTERGREQFVKLIGLAAAATFVSTVVYILILPELQFRGHFTSSLRSVLSGRIACVA